MKKYHPILVVFSLFLVYALIHVAFIRYSPDGLFDFLKLSMLFALMVFVTIYLDHHLMMREVPKVMTALAFVLSVLGFVGVFKIIWQTGFLSVPYQQYHVDATLGNRNMFCQLLFFSFPFSITVLFLSKEKFWKNVASVTFVLALILLVLLSNRATWLALLVGSAALGVCYKVALVRKLEIAVKKTRQLLLSVLCALAVVVIFHVDFSGMAKVERNMGALTDVRSGSIRDRYHLWSKTVECIQEKPVVGHGLSAWRIEVLRKGNAGLVSENNITFFQRPHNDFLWVFCELGLIGGLLYVSIFVVLFYYLVRVLRTQCGFRELLFYAIVLIMLLGLLVYSFVSFPRERMEYAILLGLFSGILIRREMIRHNPVEEKQKQKALLFTPAILFLFAICLIVVGYKRMAAEVSAKQMLLAKHKGDNARVIRTYRPSIDTWYPIDCFSTPVIWYRGNAFYNLGQMKEAMADFNHAYRLNPFHIHVINNLATCYEIEGDHSHAIDLYKRSLDVAPNYEQALLNLSASYYNNGDVESAYQTILKIPADTKLTRYRAFRQVISMRRAQTAQ